MGGHTKVSKQSETYDEPITAELLLRSHTVTEKILAEIRSRNEQAVIGDLNVVDYWGKSNHDSLPTKKIKASEIFMDYDTPKSKQKKLRWLSRVQSARSGAFYTLDNLIGNGIIAESERSLFKLPSHAKDYPWREIYQYHRIKLADGSEFLSALEMWHGLTRVASVVSISVNDLCYYIQPAVERELRYPDGRWLQSNAIYDEKTVQVSIVRSGSTSDPVGEKVYMVPFSQNIARSALKLAHGSYTDLYNGCSLSLIKQCK
jgi:hypothetical protein